MCAYVGVGVRLVSLVTRISSHKVLEHIGIILCSVTQYLNLLSSLGEKLQYIYTSLNC